MENNITTRNKILIACKKNMKEKGYRKATLTQIAKDAHVNLSLLNYYFPKKENLLIAIMAEFINSIYYFALLNSNKNSLVAYIATSHVYYDVLLNNPEHLRFYKDVMNRPDRTDLSAYKNYNKIYYNLVEYLNINITHEDIVFREISAFGANRELLYVYLSQFTDLTFDELVESITTNTCSLFNISSPIIAEAHAKSKPVIEKLSEIHFRIF
jgi:AcrR family transcriptional regulator